MFTALRRFVIGRLGAVPREDLAAVKKTVGRTGNLALKPIFNMSSRDLWQVYLIEK